MVLAPAGAYRLPHPSETAASSGLFELGADTGVRGPSLWRNSSVTERVAGLSHLQRGWDGQDAPAPSPASIRTALTFWNCAAAAGEVLEPSIGPATDGGVVLEWDLDANRSVYCYAREDRVTVAAFDNEKDFVDISLPPVGAGLLASLLLAVPAWS